MLEILVVDLAVKILNFSYICFEPYFYGEFQFSEARVRTYIQTAKQKFDMYNFSDCKVMYSSDEQKK